MISSASICVLLFATFVTYGCGSVPRKDPLQPVWDGIEQLPAKILEDMQKTFDDFSAKMDTVIDGRIESAKAKLRSSSIGVPQPSLLEEEGDTDGAKLKELITKTLVKSFENLYNNSMKSEVEITDLSFEANVIESFQDTEEKLIRHTNQVLRQADFWFDFNSTLEDHLLELLHTETNRNSSIENLEQKVLNIWDMFRVDKKDVCEAANENLQKFMIEELPSEQRLTKFESEWDATYNAVTRDLPPVFFQRDCSDVLHHVPGAPTGVYTVYPTRSKEEGVDVWCDMETDTGPNTTSGWTVMLRRRNSSAGLLNFNRSWEEYANGFGQPGAVGEWWLGLNWIHKLTYYQPYQLMFLLHDIENGDVKAYYSDFRVEDESRNFRLVVGGFESSLDDAFEFHYGQPFSTYDRDNEKCTSCNCAANNGGGWWYNLCHRTVLTATFPTSNDREAKTIRWLSGSWWVLDDVTMMIKPSSWEG